MATGESPGTDRFEASRERRRGVKQASRDLEQALARPVGPDPQSWFGAVASGLKEVGDAFRRHVEHSEGADGLLGQITEDAPRLARAVHHLEQQHRTILEEVARLEATVGGDTDAGLVQVVRQDSLALLQSIAAHRAQGADLVYEAYSVDIEGAD